MRNRSNFWFLGSLTLLWLPSCNFMLGNETAEACRPDEYYDAASGCVPRGNFSVTPRDGAINVSVPTDISVTFPTPMDPASLTGQTIAGTCSGTIQVSLDDFATCIAFSSDLATMSEGDTLATLTPAPGLLVHRTYKIRVMNWAQEANGVPLTTTLTTPTGFVTGTDNPCEGSLVISQVYGGGGNSGGAFASDFVELHNRGTTPIGLTGLSLQYASPAETTWTNIVQLDGEVAPGGFFLVRLEGSANGDPLPAADQSVHWIDISNNSGTIALVTGKDQLSAGIDPDPARVIDYVGYGTATYYERTPAPALSIATSAIRADLGCADRHNNGADFTSQNPPIPRNSAHSPSPCTCSIANESDEDFEVDYCNLQFPETLTLSYGDSADVFGQIYEPGVTEAGDANPTVAAELGIGPALTNPQYSPAWRWIDASFYKQDVNNDEYVAQVLAPPTGTYSYTYRVTLDGRHWTVCDLNGAGSNPELSFDLDRLGSLTTN